MTKGHSARRVYRKSPGRQYEYDYNPLQNQNGSQSQSGRLKASTPGERQSPYEPSTSNRPPDYNGQDTQLAPRPDPRRTRQLMRQSILASKSRTALYGGEQEQEDQPHDQQQDPASEDRYQEDTALYSNRPPRNNRPARPQIPAPVARRAARIDEVTEDGEWEELGYVDPDIGEDPLQHRVVSTEQPARRSAEPRRAITAVRRREPVPEEYDEAYEDYDYEEEDELPRRRSARKKKVTRRRLLLGLGTLAVGGAAATVAAYEIPKIPQALNDAKVNVEHDLEAAFNNGFNAGANAVRKEFITALDHLEGVSLDAAIAAAKLTRVAYDVFVSPLVKFLATVADDFLSVTLRALITARHWLGNIGQDNSTLASLQDVLQTWVNQAQQMPKQIQAIADADLDGAQSYLRALQRKIAAEQAKLNASNATPTRTTTPTARPTGTPGH